MKNIFKKTFKKGMSLLELLVTVIMVGILVIFITKVMNDLIMYKYRSFTTYQTTLSNIIVQNSIQKVDIQDFLIGGMTYRRSAGDQSKNLIYFKNTKFENNNTIFLGQINKLIEGLKIDTELPFFVFVNPEKRIGIFGVEKRDDGIDRYNVNLYFLDKNYYSKSYGMDKIGDILDDGQLNNLLEDFKNQKTVLLRDIIIDKDGSYEEDVDLMKKFMLKKDLTLTLMGGEQLNFFTDLTFSDSKKIDPEHYPTIQNMFSYGYYKQYYLIGNFSYQYLGQTYSISFNRIFKGNEVY